MKKARQQNQLAAAQPAAHGRAPAERQSAAAAPIARAMRAPGSLDADDLLALQRTLGNQSTSQLLAGAGGPRQPPRPTAAPPLVGTAPGGVIQLLRLYNHTSQFFWSDEEDAEPPEHYVWAKYDELDPDEWTTLEEPPDDYYEDILKYSWRRSRDSDDSDSGEDDEDELVLRPPSKKARPRQSGFARGTHDDRRFSSKLKLTKGGQQLEDDDPLALHLELNKGLGTGKKRSSENQVRASVSLILQHPKGALRVITINIPKTFTSGEDGIDVAALKRWLVQGGIIGGEGEYSAERHAHSEQDLTLHLLANGAALFARFADLVDPQEVLVGVMLDLVSAPNTICHPCHRSLELLMGPQSAWLQGILAMLAFHGIWVGPEVRSVIRASAENVFTGAKVQFVEARKQGQIEEETDLDEGSGTGPLFIETVTELGSLSKARDDLSKAIVSRAGKELGTVKGQPGTSHKITQRLGRLSLGAGVIGLRIVLGGKIWQISSIDGGITVKLVGFQTPSDLADRVTHSYGAIREISGAGLNCYIRSIVTGLHRQGLVSQDQIENLVSALSDTLAALGLRFQGQMINAGGLAAAVVRQTISDFLNRPDLQIRVRVVQWDSTTGQLVDFYANAGNHTVTLFYTPGHFDLIG